MSSAAALDASRQVLSDASLLARTDASPGASGDQSPGSQRYASVVSRGGRRVAVRSPRRVAQAGTSEVSPVDRHDASASAGIDASLVDQGCAWCRRPLRSGARADSIFCGRKCRQAAFRIRRRHQVEAREAQPMRMAYADPPYPGCAWMYADQDTFAGEVDHVALVASLEASYDGFALSTSSRALATVLPLGRELRPGKRDWLAAQPARQGGSDLIGRKPEAFVTWMFGLLGLLPGDDLVDLYPGSGIVGRAWAEVCRAAG